jgi:hypothetical protein
MSMRLTGFELLYPECDVVGLEAGVDRAAGYLRKLA